MSSKLLDALNSIDKRKEFSEKLNNLANQELLHMLEEIAYLTETVDKILTDRGI